MIRTPALILLLAAPAVLAAPTQLRLQSLGTTRLPAPASGAASADDVRSGIPHRTEVDIHSYLSGGPTPGHPLPASSPAASGLSLSLVNGGFSGFNGLTHRDQRNAGTGIYTNTQFSLEPPDQALCVGNGFVVEAVNTALAIYDQSGVRKAGPVALNQFFGLVPEFDRKTGISGDFTSDPRCFYDWKSGHFFLIILQIDPAPGVRSHTLIARSQSGDPTGGWDAFALDATNDGLNGTPSHPGCPCFGDQPLFGVDANAVFVTTNEFGNQTFNGAEVYGIGKSLFTGGTGSAVLIDNLTLAEGIAYTLQPATTPPGGEFARGSGGTEFFASALDFSGTLDDRIAVWAMTGTRSLNTATPAVAFGSKVIKSEVYGQPPDADQKSGPTPLRDLLGSLGSAEPLEFLSTNDDRMQQAVYSDGKLWTALTTVVTPKGDTADRAGIAWFKVKVEAEEGELEAKIEKQGYVSVPGANVFYPSVAVTKDDRAAIGFSLSGQQFYPSAAYVRLSGHGTSAVHIAASGAGPQDGFTGYFFFGGNGHARWGDYSAAVAGADGSIWMAAEYIPGGKRSLLANWGTFITRLAPQGEDEGGSDE